MVWDLLQPFVSWWGDTWFAMWLGQSTMRVAWLMTFHLFGLTVLLGSTIVQCLRLFGVLLEDEPAARVARSLGGWHGAGLALTLGSGFLIFTGGAATYFEGNIFRTKMKLLLLALAFHFTLFRRVMLADEGRFSPLMNAIAGALALTLWFSVGMAGRAIGFF
jgi:hypothetical protein